MMAKMMAAPKVYHLVAHLVPPKANLTAEQKVVQWDMKWDSLMVEAKGDLLDG